MNPFSRDDGPTPPRPRCGGRMHSIETLDRGCQPRATPHAPCGNGMNAL